MTALPPSETIIKIGASIQQKIGACAKGLSCGEISGSKAAQKAILETRPDSVEIDKARTLFLKDLDRQYKKAEIIINGEKYIQYMDSGLGSNPAFWAANTKGEIFYIKTAATKQAEGQLESELIAGKLYKLAGFDAPQAEMCTFADGTKGLKSIFEPNLESVLDRSAYHEGFGADAWLANWDSILNRNTLQKNGKLFKLDNGGALTYRAQGKRKENFGDTVEELTTLLDRTKNMTTAAVFSSMKHETLIKSLKRVTSISDDAIREAVKDEKLAQTLINRKNYLETVLREVETTPLGNAKLKNYMPWIINQIETGKKYADVIENMTAQRLAMTNTINPTMSVEERLRGIKDNCLYQNEFIRDGIAARISSKEPNLEMLSPIGNELLARTDALIAQSSIPRDLCLYRGATPYDFGFKHMSAEEFIKTFFKAGKVFEIPSYIETSLNKETARGFARKKEASGFVIKYNVPKGTPGIYMENLGQTTQTTYGNEQEILLARNLIGQFKKITKTAFGTVVEIDILHKKPLFKKVHDLAEDYLHKPIMERIKSLFRKETKPSEWSA